MKFLRIGEDSFKCMVTLEDLQPIGCTFTDIIKDQAGLQSLLDMVIEEAEDKIGYVIDSTRVVVNLQLVDSSSAVVTVSSCNEDKDFPELPPLLSQVPDSLLGNAVQDTRQSDAPDSFAENKIIFCFESFKNLEGYAAAYPFATGIFNSVYKDDAKGVYYLCFETSGINPGDVDVVCSFTLEYARQCPYWDNFYEYCNEHFTCLLKANAIEKLAEFAV
ncbi:MAG: adaptor protein MecA [Lachnospiraceae bacterium]|nr:adaptor protein MecA [Lachnospiraceae bacterium]